MKLVRPSIAYQDSYLAAVREFQAEGRKKDFDTVSAEHDFADYVRRLCAQARGEYLPTGFVPQSVYWLVDKEEFVGAVNIRHRLNEHLLQIGGHIGYEIRPSKRRVGYGTHILRLALPKARELGIERALLTCDETNTASRKIIEKNSGVLENKVPNPEGGPDKLRFWFDLSMI